MAAEEIDPGSASGRTFAIDVLRYLPSSILPAVIAALAAAIFTRLFAPSQYGIYSLALAVVVPVTSILTVWLEQPTGRFYVVYEREGKGHLYRQLVATLTLYLGCLIILVSILVVLVSVVAQSSFGYPLLVAGAAFMVLTQSVSTVVMAILPVSMQIAAYRRATIVSSTLALLIALCMIWLLSRDVAWILWGQGMGRLVVLPYVVRKSGIRLGDAMRSWNAEVADMLHRFWRYGGPMMLWFVASTILNTEDRYVIAAFHGAKEVGLYSANYNLVYGLATLLSAPVIIAAGPLLYRQWAAGAFDGVRRTIAQMTELYVLIALAMLGSIATAGNFLVAILLGPRFHAGSVILVPVLAGLIFWGCGILGHKGLEIAERTLRMASSALAAALLNLVLNLALVPHYGYVAAAYSTLIAYGAYVGMIWFQTRSLIAWDVNWFVALYLACAALAVALGLCVALLGWNTSDYVRWIAGLVVFVSVYIALLWLTARRHIATLVSFDDRPAGAMPDNFQPG